MDKDTPIARFLEKVAADIAKTSVVAVISLALACFGFVTKAPAKSPFDWPTVVALLASVVAILSIVHLLRLGMRLRARALLGTASGSRVAVLLPRIAGDDRRGSKREIVRDALAARLADGIELLLWPETLEIGDGRDSDAQKRVVAKGLSWLRASKCDVFVIGAVRGDNVLGFRIGTAAGGIEQRTFRLSGEGFDLPPDFGSEICSAVISQLLADAAKATDAGRARMGDLNRVALKFEALLRNLPDPELVLGYTGILMRSGEHAGSTEVQERAIELAIDVLERFEDNLATGMRVIACKNIASMLISLGHFATGASTLKVARSYVDKAKKLDPSDRADINYGILLSMIGAMEFRADVLEEAVAEFGNIIAEEDDYDTDTVGKAYHNMGITYMELYKLTCDAELLDGAVAMLELSLPYRSIEEAPFYWAKTNCVLGGALTLRGKATRNIEDYEAALEHLDVARRLYAGEQWREEAAEVTYNMALTRSELAAATSDAGALVGAAADLEEVSITWGKDRNHKWANVQNALGSIYIKLAILQLDDELADVSARHFLAARSVLLEDDAEACTGTSLNAAHAKMVAGVLRRSANEVMEAAAEIKEVYDQLRGRGHAELTRMAADNLVECYEKAAILSNDHSYLGLARSLREEQLLELADDVDLEQRHEGWLELASLDLLWFQQSGDSAVLDRATSLLESIVLDAEHAATAPSQTRDAAEAALLNARQLRAAVE